MTILGAEFGFGQIVFGLLACVLMALGTAGHGSQSRNIQTVGAVGLFTATGWALFTDGVIAAVVVFLTISFLGGMLTSVIRQQLRG